MNLKKKNCYELKNGVELKNEKMYLNYNIIYQCKFHNN